MQAIKLPTGDVIAFAIALLVAFSFGFSYGNVANQATYLPHALNHLNPDFLAYDWLVQETTPYHARFEWIVWLTYALGSVAWWSAILNLVLATAGIFVIYRVALAYTQQWGLVAFFIVLLFVMIDRTQTVGGSYLFEKGLQPSAVASVAWLVSILWFLRGRIQLSGVFLALGGLFHANFLILGIGIFGLAHLAMGRDALVRRLAGQLVPSLLILAFDLPLILAMSGGEGSAAARTIFQQIRAPHHYVPETYLMDFWAWSGWLLAGLGATLTIDVRSVRLSTLALLGTIAASVIGATVLTTLVFVPAISQLYVWRLAPFGVIISQVAVASFAVRVTGGTLSLFDRNNPAPRVLIALGSMLVLRGYLHNYQILSYPTMTILSMSVLTVGLAMLIKYKPSAVGISASIFAVAAVGLLFSYLPGRVSAAYNRSTLFSPQILGEEGTLYQWAQRSPINSNFLIPPELEEFRLLGARAIVVDWKSTPIKPSELIAWHQRVEEVAGRKVENKDDAVAGYRNQSLAQLSQTALRFGANYIVIDRKYHIAEIGGEDPLFVSDRYAGYPATPRSAS
ncbi:MAG: hypothetical protein CAF41_015930 [Nitrospira sp. CG24A]|nr:MAG: hypothetical protein CAF41_015930 [Nitrospira sp. CG24A]